MNYEVKKKIFEKIKEYDRIMLFRHVRNDGDCVGATKGLKRILQLTWPEKEILLIDDKAFIVISQVSEVNGRGFTLEKIAGN